MDRVAGVAGVGHITQYPTIGWGKSPFGTGIADVFPFVFNDLAFGTGPALYRASPAVQGAKFGAPLPLVVRGSIRVRSLTIE